LRDISNADKHRRLTVMVREDFVTGMSSESGRRTTLPTGQTLEIDPHQSIMIDLPQGKQFVMVTLDTIEGMVHETLGRFVAARRPTCAACRHASPEMARSDSAARLPPSAFELRRDSSDVLSRVTDGHRVSA
jgi:hypothetical protein